MTGEEVIGSLMPRSTVNVLRIGARELSPLVPRACRGILGGNRQCFRTVVDHVQLIATPSRVKVKPIKP